MNARGGGEGAVKEHTRVGNDIGDSLLQVLQELFSHVGIRVGHAQVNGARVLCTVTEFRR